MTGWAIEALAWSSLLMLAVLALRRTVAERFGAHAAYALWLLPALRLVLPRLPEAAVTPMPAIPLHLDFSHIADAPVAPVPASLPVVFAAPIPWATIALAVWLGGALVHFAWQIACYRRFLRRALDAGGAGHRASGVVIRTSAEVPGPLAAGLMRRHVLLPHDFAHRYNAREQRLVLAHEIAHHRRGDLFANLAGLAMLSLNWFNPLAHWAYRAFRADQELACDATVLGRADPSLRPAYGAALIKSVRGGAPAAACALGPATLLKRRMKMLGTVSQSSRRRIAGAAFAAVTVLTGLGLTASRGSASMIYSHNVARPGLSLFDGPAPAVAAAPAADAKPIVYAALATPAPKPIRMALAAPVMMSDAVEAAPPPPPVPPVAAVEPVPPPPVGVDPADFRAAQRDALAARRDAAAARREAALEAARGQREAAHARAEAQREAMLARAEGQREAAHASAEAQREAARAMAEGQRKAARATAAAFDSATLSARIAAETRQALAESCPHARPATGPESDQQAIRRLSRGCVDMAMIDRQIDTAMRQARDQIAHSDMPAEARQRALEGMDRAMAHRHRAATEQD